MFSQPAFEGGFMWQGPIINSSLLNGLLGEGDQTLVKRLARASCQGWRKSEAISDGCNSWWHKHLGRICAKSMRLRRCLCRGGFELLDCRWVDRAVTEVFHSHQSWVEPRNLDSFQAHRKKHFVRTPYSPARQLHAVSGSLRGSALRKSGR